VLNLAHLDSFVCCRSDDALCLSAAGRVTSGTRRGTTFVPVDARELSDLRREYAAGGLDEADLDPDPVSMFRRWMHDAVRARVHEPNAFVLSTVGADGAPASRIVLLKGLDERGFVFFTNYTSRKGQEIAANPRCALLFPWHPLERQVRVEGSAVRLSDAANDAYFAGRPRTSQIGAWASQQSTVVPDRRALDALYGEVAARFGEGEVPRPPYWGGYCVRPQAVEFWQGRLGRMHDRLRYRRTDEIDGWATERLAP
jgi:pyridoxamine 5'-phosphate oxidase